MKLLFLSSHAHWILDESQTRTSGGAELQVALLAKQLALLGHDVTIAAGDTGQPDSFSLANVRIRNAGKFHTGRLFEMLRAIPRVLTVIREERPEWVVVMGWTAWLFVLWLGRPLLGYKLDFICALDSEINGAFRRENPIFGNLFEFAVRRCDARHAITRDQLECYNRRGMKATLYRYLVFAPKVHSCSQKKVDFLWVSRCHAIKRPYLFLELAKALPNCRFQMICPGEDRDLWNDVSRRTSEIPNLEFIESVPYHEIQRYYDEARIFVNTSEWEGWPNSFIQAGLGRTALLSLDVNPDGIFEKFGLGFFAAGDMEKLKSGASEMLRHNANLVVMQESCARFVAEMHDNVKETDAFLAGLG